MKTLWVQTAMERMRSMVNVNRSGLRCYVYIMVQ